MSIVKYLCMSSNLTRLLYGGRQRIASIGRYPLDGSEGWTTGTILSSFRRHMPTVETGAVRIVLVVRQTMRGEEFVSGYRKIGLRNTSQYKAGCGFHGLGLLREPTRHLVRQQHFCQQNNFAGCGRSDSALENSCSRIFLARRQASLSGVVSFSWLIARLPVQRFARNAQETWCLVGQ